MGKGSEKSGTSLKRKMFRKEVREDEKEMDLEDDEII
jgi:hypothetical protein